MQDSLYESVCVSVCECGYCPASLCLYRCLFAITVVVSLLLVCGLSRLIEKLLANNLKMFKLPFKWENNRRQRQQHQPVKVWANFRICSLIMAAKEARQADKRNTVGIRLALIRKWQS